MGNIHLLIKEVVEQGPFLNNVSKTYLLAKRFLDITAALLAFILFSPVILLIVIRIKICSRKAVLNAVNSCGLKGMRFKTYEFGSMVKGHYIRKLPLLFNLLKGDMSIVGPQPTPLSELEKHGTWYYLRMSAKPGITGLWQIGEQHGDINEMVHVDLKYIRERSLAYDYKIILAATGLIFKNIKCIRKTKTV